MEITKNWETEMFGAFGLSAVRCAAPVAPHQGTGLSIAGYLPTRDRFAGVGGAGIDGAKVAVDASQGVVYPRLEGPPV
jgi:hypothetical protein